MMQDLRESERYSMHGMAALVGDGQCLIGHVSDISGNGIALNIHGRQGTATDIRKTWLCRVISPELPETLEFIVKVVRPRAAPGGYGLGCTIAAIDDKDRAVLEAFQSKRQHAASYH